MGGPQLTRRSGWPSAVWISGLVQAGDVAPFYRPLSDPPELETVWESGVAWAA